MPARYVPTKVAPDILDGKYKGRLVALNFHADDRGASLTNDASGTIELDFDCRPIAMHTTAKTVTGACTVRLYNVTDAAAITAAVTPVAADSVKTTTFSAGQNTLLEKGNKVRLEVTTPAGGALEDVHVNFIVEVEGQPTNY